MVPAHRPRTRGTVARAKPHDRSAWKARRTQELASDLDKLWAPHKWCPEEYQSSNASHNYEALIAMLGLSHAWKNSGRELMQLWTGCDEQEGILVTAMRATAKGRKMSLSGPSARLARKMVGDILSASETSNKHCSASSAAIETSPDILFLADDTSISSTPPHSPPQVQHSLPATIKRLHAGEKL